MQGIRRKVVYITLYEAIAIACSSAGLALLTDSGVGHASLAAVAASLIAVGWNLTYNSLFERWEAQQTRKGRSLLRRVVHAVGFESGLVIILVPLFAWWLGITLWEAFVLDLGLIVFFLVYTFLFNLAFDRLFGLPASAAPARA